MGAIGRALKNKMNEVKVYAAMPGNKGRYDGDFRHDITELDGMDNLQSPTGIIKESQETTAKIYGVTSARYLVNGSSSGNLSMIFTYFKEGDTVLVERNCHKSVYNGLILRKLKPIFIYPKLSEEGILMPVMAEDVKREVESAGADSIKGVILTSPTYSGLYSDLTEIYEYTKSKGMALLIDGAHGAHLKGIKGFEDYYSSCDSIVVSAHKTMGCLNQGSILLNNRSDKADALLKYSNVFQTTSPSYIIMESIEKAVEEMEAGAFLDFRRIDKIREGNYKNTHFYKGKAGLVIDPLKLNIVCKDKGPDVYKYLIDKGVYPEMVTKGSVLLMLSPFNTMDDFNYLGEVFGRLDDYLDTLKDSKSMEFDVKPENIVGIYNQELVRGLEMYEAVESLAEYVKIDDSVGRICAEMLIPYPPGVPLVVPGEIINMDVINRIKWYRRNDIDIQGVKSGMVPVLKEIFNG